MDFVVTNVHTDELLPEQMFITNVSNIVNLNTKFSCIKERCSLLFNLKKNKNKAIKVMFQKVKSSEKCF